MFQRLLFKNIGTRIRNTNYLNQGLIYSKYLKFSNLNKEEGAQEIINVLRKIPFENGKNLVDLNYIVDLQIKDDGSVNLMLKLDQNYRKIKTLCQTELTTVPWIKNISINMAPKVF